MRLLISLVFLIMLYPAAMHQATAQEASQKPGHVKLTKAHVETVLKILPRLRALDTQYKVTVGRGSGAVTQLTDETAYKTAVKKIAGANGFSDSSLMMKTVRSTLFAAGFIQSGQTLDQVTKDADRISEDIKNSPQLSEAEKKQMLRDIADQREYILSGAKNVDVVQKLYPKLAEIMSK